MDAFKEEYGNIAHAFRLQKNDVVAAWRAVTKLEKVCVASEIQLERARTALQVGDIASLYTSLRVLMPTKCKVAMFLVNQFESSNFDFIDIVDREEELQEYYEDLERRETEASSNAGVALVEHNTR